MKKFWRKGKSDLDNRVLWAKYEKITDYKVAYAHEGDIILAQVGVVKRRESTKKAKPFEVGKVYDRTDTAYQGVRIIAITLEGQLIGENANSNVLNRFNAQGTAVVDGNNREVGNRGFDLKPEYEDVPGELYVEEVK